MDKVQLLVVNNRDFFGELVSELYGQFCGKNGRFDLSEEVQSLSFCKHASVLLSPVDLDPNTKSNLAGLISELTKNAYGQDLSQDTFEISADLQKYAYNLISDQDASVSVPANLDATSLFRHLGFSFDTESGMEEKVYDYVRITKRYSDVGLFVFVSLSSYMSESRLLELVRNVQYLNVPILFVEPVFPNIPVQCKLIDDNLCEINGIFEDRKLFEA